jgi:hypothetical protein
MRLGDINESAIFDLLDLKRKLNPHEEFVAQATVKANGMTFA